MEERVRDGARRRPGERSTNGAFQIYEWAYGEPPPNNAANVLEPLLRNIFTGIQLAGPDLTPETFRDGLFRYPPSGGGPTEPQISRGKHGVWPDEDWGGGDESPSSGSIPRPPARTRSATRPWHVPLRQQGRALYLGKCRVSRRPGCSTTQSVTVYDQVPEGDQTPD